MIITFNSVHNKLICVGEKQTTFALYGAANNADSTSKGSWPVGVYKIDTLIRVTGEDAESNGKYGRWFLRANDFAPRTGMGIHAGRRTKTDLAGRHSFNHATMGCIRTTDEAMQYIADHNDSDPVTKIVVV